MKDFKKNEMSALTEVTSPEGQASKDPYLHMAVNEGRQSLEIERQR